MEFFDFIFAIFNFIKNVAVWVKELSLRSKILLATIILIPILWVNIPNPNSILITPLLGNPLRGTVTYDTKVSEVSISTSVYSELIDQLTSLSKHNNSIELIKNVKSLIDQNEKIKGTIKKIEIPIGAGRYSSSGFELYTWKKTYRRFFTENTPENTLFEYNLIAVDGKNILYFRGSRKNYLSLTGEVYIGIIKE